MPHEPFWPNPDATFDLRPFEKFAILGHARFDGFLRAQAELPRGDYSPSYLTRGMHMMAASAHMFPLAKAINVATGKPVLLLTQPLLARKPDWAPDGLDQAAWDAAANFLDGYAKNAGARFMPQPLKTVNDFCYTDPRFATGRRHPTGTLPTEDLGHMNVEYAKIVLDGIRGRSSKGRTAQARA